MFRLLIIVICLSCALEGTVQEVRNRLTKAALESGSDEVIILRDGKPVYYFRSPTAPQRYDLGEMTGMFLSLAVGSLIEQKAIPCLDAPVSHYLPHFHSAVQIRALLNHTSGLSKDEDLQTLYAIIGKASGKSTQVYIGEKFLAPLEISDYSWVTETGYPRLMLRAQDLARVGAMLANNGKWDCKQLISLYWMGILRKPSQNKNPFFGQQIWLEYCDLETYWDEQLLNQYCNAGMRLNFLANLANFNGRVIHFGGSAVHGNILRLWGRELCPDQYKIVELIQETYFADLPLGHFTPGCIKSLIGWGAGGQQLIVMPQEGFVGVRFSGPSRVLFTDFVIYVDALSKEFTGWID